MCLIATGCGRPASTCAVPLFPPRETYLEVRQGMRDHGDLPTIHTTGDHAAMRHHQGDGLAESEREGTILRNDLFPPVQGSGWYMRRAPESL